MQLTQGIKLYTLLSLGKKKQKTKQKNNRENSQGGTTEQKIHPLSATR